MFKHALLIILLSIAAIFFQNQLVWLLHSMLSLHNWLAVSTAHIFSSDSYGQFLQSIISLILVPIVGGAITAIILLIAKRDHMPHTLTAVWFVWTILLVTMLAQRA